MIDIPRPAAAALIHLFQGPVERDRAPETWRDLTAHQQYIRPYCAVLGLEVYLDEADGFAFLRQRNELEDTASPEAASSSVLPHVNRRAMQIDLKFSHRAHHVRAPDSNAVSHCTCGRLPHSMIQPEGWISRHTTVAEGAMRTGTNPTGFSACAWRRPAITPLRTKPCLTQYHGLLARPFRRQYCAKLTPSFCACCKCSR